MRNFPLYLFIASLILSCKSEHKEKATESQPPVYVTNETEVPKAKSIAIEKDCSLNNPVFTLGKGLIMVNGGDDSENTTSTIEIYNDSLLQDKYISWNYYEKKPAKPVCSKYFKPDYGILHFVYLKETAKTFQIL